jgi:hypothetical protein
MAGSLMDKPDTTDRAAITPDGIIIRQAFTRNHGKAEGQVIVCHRKGLDLAQFIKIQGAASSRQAADVVELHSSCLTIQ